MMDLALHNNDLSYANGDINLCANDTLAIAQTISIRLKTLAGEWFMDSQIGLPYLSEILGHKRNDRFLRHAIVPTIESVAGVREITNFSVEQTDDRGIIIKLEARLNNQTIIPIKASVEI